MFTKIYILICIQLIALSVTFAQITFTREWVTGKRSDPSSSTMDLAKEKGLPLDVNLTPAIEFLLQAENLRRAGETMIWPKVHTFMPSKGIKCVRTSGSINNHPNVLEPSSFVGSSDP